MQAPWLNLVFAWLGILLGFLSGLYLGLNFHREQWLGGYGSFQRRLYRLAHISLFGLAIVNFIFYQTAQQLSLTHHASRITSSIASWAFIVGAISMPACCLLMAHFPRTHPLFAIPVLSLLLGGSLTLVAVSRPQSPTRSVSPISNRQTATVTHHVSRFTFHAPCTTPPLHHSIPL